MPPPSIWFLPIAFAAALLALVALRPAITRSFEGKLLAFVALFVAPAIAAYSGVQQHIERSRTTEYCLSCHVMKEYGKSLRVESAEYLAAAHYENNLVPRDRACASCHTNYGLYGDLHANVRGAKHVVKTYFGSVPDTIKIARRFKNRDCLRCHLGARLFEEAAAHQSAGVSMVAIKAGKMSCMTGGCHHTVHDVHGLDGVAMWDPARSPAPAAARPDSAAATVPGAIAPPGGTTPDGEPFGFGTRTR